MASSLALTPENAEELSSLAARLVSFGAISGKLRPLAAKEVSKGRSMASGLKLEKSGLWGVRLRKLRESCGAKRLRPHRLPGH